MVKEHHPLSGHKFDQTLGDSGELEIELGSEAWHAALHAAQEWMHQPTTTKTQHKAHIPSAWIESDPATYGEGNGNLIPVLCLEIP